MTLAPKHAFDGTARPELGDKRTPAAQEGRFVINLCPVVAPITIPQPRASQLTRFHFFFSHCWEDGRRRYRLNLGFFQTIVEAQKWHAILTRIYPDAFVIESPAAQPDLLVNTQVLRMLETGSVDRLEHGADRMTGSADTIVSDI
jgi:hypothetical protein